MAGDDPKPSEHSQDCLNTSEHLILSKSSEARQTCISNSVSRIAEDDSMLLSRLRYKLKRQECITVGGKMTAKLAFFSYKSHYHLT